MRSREFLRWNLAFKNEALESIFINSRKEFQIKASRLVIMAIFIITLIGWIINPFDVQLYEGFSLSLLILISVLKISYHLIPLKYRHHLRSNLQLMFIILTLFFLIGSLENTRKISEGEGNNVLFFIVGILLEFALAAMIFARIGWIKMLIIFSIITVLISIFYLPSESSIRSSYKSKTSFFWLFLLFILKKQSEKIFLK